MKSNIIELLRFLKINYIFGLKEPLKGLIKGIKLSNEYSYLKNQKKVIIMQTPTHRNLGDHAIAYAQKQFVIDNATDFEIIEIPYKDVYKSCRNIKKVLNNDDIIIIHGGGNMGDLYIYEEYMRRHIISYFRKYKVISFPQSIYFSDSLSGNIELFISKNKYRKNKNLLLVAREKESYEKMKKIFAEQNVILTPDIVLSLDKRAESTRKGILTCLRNDKEKLITESDVKKLYQNLKEKYQGVIVTDTLLDKDVAIGERETELNKMWKAIRGAEVVITDRLHGMIFCAITSTPCIVFRNSNNKIEQSYNNWLSNLGYFKFCNVEEIKTITKIIDELIGNVDRTKQFNDCMEKFNPLKEQFQN